MPTVVGVDVGLQNLAICLVTSRGEDTPLDYQILTWTLQPLLCVSKKTQFVERLVENVQHTFDILSKQFPSLAQADVVMIELQMKTNHLCANLSQAIAAWFLDHAVRSQKNILVQFINPKHKLGSIHINEDTGKSRYENVKAASVTLVQSLMEQHSDWKDFFMSHVKKDDLSDALLTALVYFGNIKDQIQK